MIKCAVLGSPISHSLSPLLHRTAYEELEIEGSYDAIEINEETFNSFFDKAKGENWTGFSLTMPLKELAYLRADSSDELVKKITSANTLLNVGGKWVALSTDLLAFKSLIEIDSYAKVGVIGGGGTARAALGALSGEISSVDVFLRSPNRFDALQTAAGETKVNIKEMDQINNNYDLLISTTPAGVLDTHVDKLAGGQGTFFEVLYKPWPTNAVSAWNGKIISGLDLLVEQAMYQITFMTGQDFNYHMMRGRLLAVAK